MIYIHKGGFVDLSGRLHCVIQLFTKGRFQGNDFYFCLLNQMTKTVAIER